MSEKRTALRISLLVISAAIVAVFTLIVRIPSMIGGYISLCDAAITFVSIAFGPVVGFVAGGLGTAMADIVGGYPQWALISFIVHGVEGLVIGIILKRLPGWAGKIVAIIWTTAVVAGGYLALTTLAGLATFSEAVAEVVGNVLQGGVGSVIGTLLYTAVRAAYPRLDNLRW